ncbi:MAG: hypothetical protein MMC33_007465 [Icmadophila ericetorum]|nr:hypothetical protein [Icmadophila ericetorum]
MVAKRNMDHEYRSRIEKQIRDARGILFGENIPISDEDLQQKLVVWSGQVSAWNCLVDRFPTAAEAARDWKAELKDASLAALACHNADDAQHGYMPRHAICGICHEKFDHLKNPKEACQSHYNLNETRPGILRPDWDSDFWEAICDEANDNPAMLADLEETHRNMWTWDCCSRFDGEAKWCKIGPHRECEAPRLYDPRISPCVLPRRVP